MARALRAGKTLTPRFTDFSTDFEKKTDCFAVYPAPLPTVPKMLIGKVDQCWRIRIFLYGHFLWVREPQFPKIQVKGTEKGA